MGFGTGHHATTRLCLRALQELKSAWFSCPGSRYGVRHSGDRGARARRSRGDRNRRRPRRDSVGDRKPGSQSRRERRPVRGGDLRSEPLQRADVVTANLTGALLIRSADLLLGALNANGALIVSGLQSHERDDVVWAFERVQCRMGSRGGRVDGADFEVRLKPAKHTTYCQPRG